MSPDNPGTRKVTSCLVRALFVQSPKTLQVWGVLVVWSTPHSDANATASPSALRQRILEVERGACNWGRGMQLWGSVGRHRNPQQLTLIFWELWM